MNVPTQHLHRAVELALRAGVSSKVSSYAGLVRRGTGVPPVSSRCHGRPAQVITHCLALAFFAFVAFGTSSTYAADKRRDAVAAKTTPTEATPPGKGFDAFQLILERNIFNPNRVGKTRAAPEEKPLRVDEISLVGTMDYEKGVIAFFDSPDSAYRKTLHEGESVGEFKVQRISAEVVELMRDDKIVTLKVAEQLRRAEGGDWVVTTTQRVDASASSSGSTLSRTQSPSAPVEIPADASEVLKRLMKKRDKQLK